MKKTIVWMLIVAMMLTGCVGKQEPTEHASSAQQTEVEPTAAVTEIQEETQAEEEIELPEEEIEETDPMEIELEEPTTTATESTPTEAKQEAGGATQPVETVGQSGGSIDLPEDEI